MLDVLITYTVLSLYILWFTEKYFVQIYLKPNYYEQIEMDNWFTRCVLVFVSQGILGNVPSRETCGNMHKLGEWRPKFPVSLTL